jgi:hypothetical protein
MATAFTPGLQVKAQTTIRKVRELPTAGDVLVKVGESVRGHQEIARARQPGELRILKVAEALGIEPIEVMAGLKTEVGKTISEGTIVCEHTGLFGLFRSSYKSPVAGVVEFITERTGHIGVRLPEIGIALDAYIDGVVTDIKGSKSITIESNAAFIQGIFGVGGERRGKITNLKVPPTKILTPAEIPASAKDAILVGGTRPQLAALRRAADAGAAGLVVGSIDDEALAGFLGYDLGIALTGDEEIPFTIIVTEGFGELAISPRIVDLLQSLEGETASINGATQVRAGALQPPSSKPPKAVQGADSRSVLAFE